MVGETLNEIREHVESVASVDGEYGVVCGRTGDCPVPVAGLRFPDRDTARDAARAAEQYRAALRRYDSRLPYYDLIVCQEVTCRPETEPPLRVSNRSREKEGVKRSNVEARTTRLGGGQLIEFCHDVAAAVFETLSTSGHETVESAVMDTYFALAEHVDDTDDLCLCLLESMARELDRALDPTQQADLLARAATRLVSPAPSTRPVVTTFDRLQRAGVHDRWIRSNWSVDLLAGQRTVIVELSGYALSPQNGQLPVLPMALDLLRHDVEWSPSTIAVTPVDDGWRLALTLAREPEPEGLISAPIRREV